MTNTVTKLAMKCQLYVECELFELQTHLAQLQPIDVKAVFVALQIIKSKQKIGNAFQELGSGFPGRENDHLCGFILTLIQCCPTVTLRVLPL